VKRKHIFLPPPLIERINALSAKLGLSAGELIRRAIEEFLTRNGA